jgi:hypothetical protein
LPTANTTASMPVTGNSSVCECSMSIMLGLV